MNMFFYSFIYWQKLHFKDKMRAILSLMIFVFFYKNVFFSLAQQYTRTSQNIDDMESVFYHLNKIFLKEHICLFSFFFTIIKNKLLLQVYFCPLLQVCRLLYVSLYLSKVICYYPALHGILISPSKQTIWCVKW